MSTLENPTREQIEQFCDAMRRALLDAHDRGSIIELGHGYKTKKLHRREYGLLNVVVDVIYIGANFSAKFTERGF